MICFVWDELPQYGARCIGAFVDSMDEKVVVVATRPRVPIKGMEDACKCNVVWIDRDETRTLKEIVGGSPRALVVSGWGVPVFNRFRDEVRAGGGRIIGMCDNNWTGFSWKELLKAIRFRLLLRGKYHGFFVPGKSGVRLLKFYGVDEERIATGMYSADASLFADGKPLVEREKKIIYVGQFIERKNVRRLVQAFQSITDVPGWTLEMYGSGPLHAEIERIAKESQVGDNQFKHSNIPNSNIKISPFVQPEQLAALYQSARVFILPSLWEHWGLVVHEGALSGCVLLLGNKTGAADDLLSKSNGVVFDPFSVDSIAAALRRAMTMSEEELQVAQQESLQLAAEINLVRFSDAVKRLIDA